MSSMITMAVTCCLLSPRIQWKKVIYLARVISIWGWMSTQSFLSYNSISFPKRCTKSCFHRGQAISGSFLWVFPIPQPPCSSPNHTLPLCSQLLISLRVTPPPRLPCHFHTAQFLTTLACVLGKGYSHFLETLSSFLFLLWIKGEH